MGKVHEKRYLTMAISSCLFSPTLEIPADFQFGVYFESKMLTTQLLIAESVVVHLRNNINETKIFKISLRK